MNFEVMNSLPKSIVFFRIVKEKFFYSNQSLNFVDNFV